MALRTILKERVLKRVEELQEKPITIAKASGLNRTFINDILVGRKTNIREINLQLLADALQCDAEYLTGEKNEVRGHPRSAHPGIQFGGTCETGVWRLPSAIAPPPPGGPPVGADPRFPGLRNIAFEVAGDGLGAEGISDGSIVTGIDASDWEKSVGPITSGMIVAARARRGEPPAFELSLRRVSKKSDGEVVLEARPADPKHKFDPISCGADVEIIAVVTVNFRIAPRIDIANRR